MTRKRKSRRLTYAQHHAIARELMRKAFLRCEHCGVRHATMIELPSGAYFRYELGLHHLNAKPWDFRRKNLRVWCQVCRGLVSRPHGAIVLRPEGPPHHPIGA